MKRMQRKVPLKPRKIPQHMSQVYMPSSDHDFQKTSEHLYTTSEDDGYYTYKCTNCKVTGRVWPDEPVIYIGAQYHANYRMQSCPGPPPEYVKVVGDVAYEIPSTKMMRRKKEEPAPMMRRRKEESKPMMRRR